MEALPKYSIGRFVIIEDGALIGDGCSIDDYCAVYAGAVIGPSTKLLYGARAHSHCRIGADCIIGGSVAERAILGDRVTYMGEMAHSHYNPRNDWDTTDEPSPVIGTGTVIGVNALLIGGIRVGRGCYVGAGEVLRHDMPDGWALVKGELKPITEFRGLLRTRL